MQRTWNDASRSVAFYERFDVIRRLESLQGDSNAFAGLSERGQA